MNSHHFLTSEFYAFSDKVICNDFCNPEEEARAYVCKPVTFDMDKFYNCEVEIHDSRQIYLMDKLKKLEGEGHVQI